MAKMDLKNDAIDGAIVVVGGSLAVKYLVPMTATIPVVKDVIAMIPVDFMGIPVHVLIFGIVALALYRAYLK